MKRHWKYILLSFFLAMVLLCTFAIHSIYKAQSYAQLINYVGIVRGATQRLVKLELSGKPSDENIKYLDDIMDNLATGEGKYHLVLINDKKYKDSLAHQEALWVELKEKIHMVREDPSTSDQLLTLSESYFEVANDTVFAAEKYANGRTYNILIFIFILFFCILTVWLFIFFSNVKRMLRLESVNQDLSDKAGRDILTGIYNQERFKSIAQLILDTHPENKYSIFYMDFEDFKYINDVFGYTYGDSILKNYAEIIQSDLAKDEVVGRINADNFVALRRYEDKDDLLERQKQLDQRIIDYMSNSYDNHALPIRCGICCVEDVIENLKIEGLLDRANFARKIVRNGTYGSYHFYDEGIRRKLFEEKTIESNMMSALENEEFEVYYQPKIDLKTETIACAEALVRWRQTDGTIVPPNKFIPVFEKNFQISLLDQYVFERVCKWLRQMIDTGKKVLPVSVNVSRLQFYNSDFVQIYTQIRDKYAIPPKLLEIEFTENIVFDNWQVLTHIVEDLKKAGFSCSMDDFGKGYSSLSMLKNINIDVLKLDAQFFNGMSANKKDRVIIEGIIKLVQQFNVVIVAEGIETADQVEFLKKAGCDMIQGYYYYRPMPQAEYENLLN